MYLLPYYEAILDCFSRATILSKSHVEHIPSKSMHLVSYIFIFFSLRFTNIQYSNFLLMTGAAVLRSVPATIYYNCITQKSNN